MFKGRSLKGYSDELEDYHGYVETDPTGRYGRFDEVLGKGAMKTVYKALDETLGMEVAWSQVKLTDFLHSPEDLERLYSEVHLLRTLNHESIIRFYTSWINVDQRTFNFITEMFTSGTLREYRKKYKQVDIRAVKIWGRQILAGLVYLHGHDPPVIHRDLKCDNIFVNGHLGQVKLGDLGLATILRGSHRAHSVIGTPEFMAPELYEENYNELVDVYSFGMCILEVLTGEYPYSECANPAQIYKKVTLGKKPRAFYKVQDLEAQRFIGKCLETASKRLSAKDLLLDPFLAFDEDDPLLDLKIGHPKPFLNIDIGVEELRLNEYRPKTNMTITGKLNPEDDTIFLKVQIADEEGTVRNVYFPFDILSDNPLDVATEMVKELEITDWEPTEIANMIEAEISGLVPNWRKLDHSQSTHNHIMSHVEDDDDDIDHIHHHHLHSPSTSSSSQVSFSGLIASHETDDRTQIRDWHQEDLFDDSSSHGSSHSGNYSNMYYHYRDEHEQITSPRIRNHHHHNCTRFCPGENSRTTGHLIARNCYNQCKALVLESQGEKLLKDRRVLTRNRSLVDMRSQLLHRSLVEEISKRRLFKTVGAVENIGFQAPCEVSDSHQPVGGGVYSMRSNRDGKKQGHKGRRV